MVIFEKSVFEGGVVPIDNSRFTGCTFRNCTLDYAGGVAPQFNRCEFDGVGIGFSGAASNTLTFMAVLYHSGFRPVIEATIEQMKTAPSQHQEKPDGQ